MSARKLTVVAGAVLVVGCWSASDADRKNAGSGISVSAGDDSLPYLPPAVGGDSVAITATDGSVVLALARDSVWMGLSPAMLAEVQAKTDTAGAGRGLGGMIERKVKSTVASALRTRIAVPVSDIEDVSYDAGAIRFSLRRDPGTIDFDDVKVGDRRSLESFREEDARLFVDSVRARLRSQ